MIVPASTFKAWFLTNVVISESGNSNLEAYVEASMPALKDELERKRILLSEPNGIYVIAHGEKSVAFIHSMKDFGGTLARPESKVACLQGLSSNACPFVIKMESLLVESNIITPKADSFLDCSTAERVLSLEPPVGTRSKDNDESVSLNCSSVFVIAPWQVKTMLESEMKDPANLCVEVIKAAKLIDEQNKENEDHTSALTGCLPLVRWLWAVAKGAIPEVVLNFGLDDGELREFSKQRHSECILPPIPAGYTTTGASSVGGSSDSFNLLSSELSRMTESNNKSNQLRALEIANAREKEDSKKNRLASWIKYGNRQMILNAMSIDGEVAADDFTEDFKDFMNAESIGQAGNVLLWKLEQRGFNNTHICEATVRNLYYGQPFSLTPGVIRGLSPFALSEASPVQQNQADRFIILHMADTKGKAMSQDDISASFSQTIRCPANFEEMEACISRHGELLDMIFGPYAPPTKSYKSFIEGVADNKSQIKAMAEKDPDVFSKVIYNVELHFQQFYRECSKRESREDVNSSYLNLEHIIFKLSLQQLECSTLPPCFKVIDKTENGTENNTPSVQPGPNPRKDGNGKRAKLANENQHDAFKLLPNENYSATFTGHEKAKSRPIFKRKTMCAKWHIQGYCFSGCNQSESHVPASQLTDEHKKNFLAWMNNCRENAKSS